jgi:hypothetical protein
MISALPIFLEATTGKSAVWNWFTKEARLAKASHTWDPERGFVPMSSEVNNTQIEDWEELDEIDDIDDNDQNNGVVFHPIELDLEKLGANPYDDDGRSLKTHIYGDRSITQGQEDSSSDDDDSYTNKKPAVKPSGTSVQTSTTGHSQSTSTLTRTPDRSAMLTNLQNDPLVLADPQIAEAFRLLALKIHAQSGPATTDDRSAKEE